MPIAVIEVLPTAVRTGFDDPAKVAFAEVTRASRRRVQAHRAYADRFPKGLEFTKDYDFQTIVSFIRFLL